MSGLGNVGLVSEMIVEGLDDFVSDHLPDVRLILEHTTFSVSDSPKLRLGLFLATVIDVAAICALRPPASLRWRYTRGRF
jgi:hypothetical protein